MELLPHLLLDLGSDPVAVDLPVSPRVPQEALLLRDPERAPDLLGYGTQGVEARPPPLSSRFGPSDFLPKPSHHGEDPPPRENERSRGSRSGRAIVRQGEKSVTGKDVDRAPKPAAPGQELLIEREN